MLSPSCDVFILTYAVVKLTVTTCADTLCPPGVTVYYIPRIFFSGYSIFIQWNTGQLVLSQTLGLLTLGAHAPEGYGSCPVCVCLSATLIWGLGLVEV